MPTSTSMEVTPEAFAALLSTVTEQNRLINLLLGKFEALEFQAVVSPSPPANVPTVSPDPPQPEAPAVVDPPSKHAESTPNAAPEADLDVAPAAKSEPEPEPESESSVLPKKSSSSENSPPSSSDVSEVASPAAPSTPNPASPPPGYVPALQPSAQPFTSIFAHHPIIRNYPPQFYYQYSSLYPPPVWPVSPNGAASPGGPAGSHPTVPFAPTPSEGGSSERGAPGTPSVSSEGPMLDPDTISKDRPTRAASVSLQDTAGTATDARIKSGAGKTRKAKQDCRFGRDCIRADCWYEHPDRSTSSESTARSSKRPCRFEMNCTRVDCRFDHPPGWSTSNIASDEADAEGTWGENNHDVTPPTENTTGSGWGDESQTVKPDDAEGDDENTDFGNWGAAPPADWGVPVSNDWGTPAADDWGAPTNNNWGAPSKDNNKTSKQDNARKPRERERGKKKKAQKVERPTATTSTSTATITSSRSPSVTPSHAPSVVLSSRAPSVAPSRAPPVEHSEDSEDTKHIETIKTIKTIKHREHTEHTEDSEETNEAALDTLDTPSLDGTDTPSTPQASSEPETPTVPFSWADEPCAIEVASSEEPPEAQSSSPQIQLPEDSLPDVPIEDDENDTASFADPVDLDKFAPSNIYDSWAPAAADWGFIPEPPAALEDANPEPVSGSDYNTWAPKEEQYSWGDPPSEPEDNRAKSKKRGGSIDSGRDNSWAGVFDNKHGAKGKGKGKENHQSQTAAASQSKNRQPKSKPNATSNYSTSTITTAAPSSPATPSVDSSAEPPLSVLPVLQAPPPGVPEEDIPDWLLGAGEDPHATLGLSRAPTPEPPSPVNVRPEPSRPKLQKIPGESFPALIPPPVHEPAATSVANGPVIRPKRMGWTVLPEASAPTDSNKASRSSGQNRKKGYYGKRK